MSGAAPAAVLRAFAPASAHFAPAPARAAASAHFAPVCARGT